MSRSYILQMSISIAAVARNMQKVLPCGRIIPLIASKTDYLQALGYV